MAGSKYFKLEKYQSENINRMSYYTALGFGMTHAVVLRKGDYERASLMINNNPDHVFDGILTPQEITPELSRMGRELTAQIRTIPFTAISDDLPAEYKDLVVSFNSDASFFNFTTALQTHIKENSHSAHFGVKTNWFLQQAQGIPSKFGGPTRATNFDINVNASLGCYKFSGIGTNSFYMEDPTIAFAIIDDLYELQTREFCTRANALGIDPQKLLNFTPTVEKLKVIRQPIPSEVTFEHQSYLLRPQTIATNEPVTKFFI